MKRAIVYVGLLIIIPVVAGAGTNYTWTGQINAYWTNAGNWNLSNSYPNTSMDTAILSGGVPNQPLIDTAISVSNLLSFGSTTFTISGSGTLTVYSAFMYTNSGVNSVFRPVIAGPGSLTVSGGGKLVLYNANTFSGGASVGTNSCLRGMAQTSSTASPFGNTNNTITLQNGGLELMATNTAAANQVGCLQPVGFGQILVNSSAVKTELYAGQCGVNSNRNYSIAGWRRDCLAVWGIMGKLANQEVFKIDAGMPALTNGILLGSFLVASNDLPANTYSNVACHATYTADNGFQACTNYVVAAADFSNIDGSGTQVVKMPSSTTQNNYNLSADNSVYGLSMGAAAQIAGYKKLSIGAGGLIFEGKYDNASITNAIQCDLNFGNTEGIIYIPGIGSSWAQYWAINGLISAGNGLTVWGRGAILCTNLAGLNNVSGPVTINGSAVWINDAVPVTNWLVLKNASVYDCNSSGNITFNNGPIEVYGYCRIVPRTDLTITLNSALKGDGILYLNPYTSQCYINGLNDNFTGGFVMRGSGTHTFAATSTSHAVYLYNQTTRVTFMGDSNVSSTCWITNEYGSLRSLDFWSGNPQVGSIRGDGDIVLGGGGSTNTTLTLGGDNTDMIISGKISQRSANAYGRLIKIGSGILTLSGANTYTGVTTVAAGTLQLSGSVAGSVTAASSATVTGSGQIKSDLNMNAGGICKISISDSNVYDQLSVTGSVTVADSVLSVSLVSGYLPRSTDAMYILLNGGTDSINGAFKDLPEGAKVDVNVVNGTRYKATVLYHANGDGGSVGNDIALTNFFACVGTVLAVR